MRLIETMQKGFNPANSQKTQISTTINTYKKIKGILDLQDNGKLKILDYGSGLGHGAKFFNETTDHNIEAFEPYYNTSKGVFPPNYTTYHGKLSEYNNLKYDVIISNCVLNVLPDDNRDLTLKRMFLLLTIGGQLFINVQSLSAIKQTMKKGTILSDTEVLTSRGTYQKGFTKKSLYSYIKSVLGQNTIIYQDQSFGVVSVVVVKT